MYVSPTLKKYALSKYVTREAFNETPELNGQSQGKPFSALWRYTDQD